MKLRKILIGIGLLVAAAILFSAIRHFQLRSATNAYIARLKAQGEPMDLAQVLPPRLAPEENSADTMRRVAVLFSTDRTLLSSNYYSAMKLIAPGRAMACSLQSNALDFGVTNTWQEVAAALAANKAVFPLLWSIIEKPKFDFGINYEGGIGGINFTNFCLTESKRAAQRLQVVALSDLHRGDHASAVKDVRAALAIVKAMSDERLVISELVRIAIAQMAVNLTWEILQSKNVTDEEMAALQKDWTELEFIHTEERALEMERACVVIDVKKFRDSNSELMRYLLQGQGAFWNDAPPLTAMDRMRLRLRAIQWRYWWSYPDELRALKGWQAVLAAPRSARTNDALLPAQAEIYSAIYQLSITNTDDFAFIENPLKVDLHYLLSSSIPVLSGVFKRVVKMEAARQLSVTALAIKRYHLRHSAYPESLAALVPEFFSEIPRDPIDGKPLRYRMNSDGTFVLYSIGDDGKDDIGNPAPSEEHKSSSAWQFGRDWVWPQPATPQEVQNFYDHPPK
jgi:hypothetical protein